MFDWIKSLFGKGKIKLEFTYIDDNNEVQKGTIKLEYIGEYIEKEVIYHAKQELQMQYDITAITCKVVAHIEE